LDINSRANGAEGDLQSQYVFTLRKSDCSRRIAEGVETVLPIYEDAKLKALFKACSNSQEVRLKFI
jgi:hypothetical protein